MGFVDTLTTKGPMSDRRIDTFVDEVAPNCIFYLPLARNILRMDTFFSLDSYRHRCTVTGALWTPSGRQFDGIDDTIVTDGQARLKPSRQFTLAAWYRPSAVPNTALRLISVEDDAGGNQGICINVNQNQAGNGVSGGAAVNLFDTAWRLAGATGLLAIGKWSFLAATYNQVAEILYHNGVTVDTRAVTGLVTFGAAPRVRVASHPTLSVNAPGLIGECIVFNQALSPYEIYRIYRAMQEEYLGVYQ